MPEEKKRKDQITCGTGMCGCGPCGSYGHCWIRIVRAIFAVVILIIVFMLGVKIGELRGVLENRYGYRMMSAQPYGNYGAYPVMQEGQGAAPAATSSAR